MFYKIEDKNLNILINEIGKISFAQANPIINFMNKSFTKVEEKKEEEKKTLPQVEKKEEKK